MVSLPYQAADCTRSADSTYQKHAVWLIQPSKSQQNGFQSSYTSKYTIEQKRDIFKIVQIKNLNLVSF